MRYVLSIRFNMVRKVEGGGFRRGRLMDLHDIRRPVHNDIRFLLAVRRAEDNRLEDSNSRGTIQSRAMSVGDLQPPFRVSVPLS